MSFLVYLNKQKGQCMIVLLIIKTAQSNSISEIQAHYYRV